MCMFYNINCPNLVENTFYIIKYFDISFHQALNLRAGLRDLRAKNLNPAQKNIVGGSPPPSLPPYPKKIIFQEFSFSKRRSSLRTDWHVSLYIGQCHRCFLRPINEIQDCFSASGEKKMPFFSSTDWWISQFFSHDKTGETVNFFPRPSGIFWNFFPRPFDEFSDSFFATNWWISLFVLRAIWFPSRLFPCV